MEHFINEVNGHLIFSDAFQISPASAIEELITYFEGENGVVPTSSTDWIQINVRNWKVGERYFIFTFVFEKRKLKTVLFTVSPKRYTETPDWDNWSADETEREKEFHDAWLHAQVGSVSKFSWGTVSSIFDERSAGNFILLQYKAG